MLPKAHFTSHSRMSGSSWMTTTLLLSSSSWPFFVKLLCVFLPPLLNLFCLHQVFTISVIFQAHPSVKYSLNSSNFLEEIFNLSHSIVFPLFLCTVHWRRPSYLSLLFFETLHSTGYVFPFLPCLSLLFFPQIFVKSPQTPLFLLPFSFLWMIVATTSCTMLQTSIHSASGTLPTKSNPLNLFIISSV